MRYMHLAIAAGLLWGGAILCVGVINLADPNYGVNFIQLTSSMYPWCSARSMSRG